MSSSTNSNLLYLIGFRIEPDIFDPQLYTIYVDDDRPISCAGQPIFFSRPDLAAIALQKSDCAAIAAGVAPTELYAVYDITDALYTLTEKDQQHLSVVLNLLNLILDYYDCVTVNIPDGYRKSLEILADHLTFNDRFVEFLDNNGLTRQFVVDVVYWSIGMILSNSKIII